MQLFHKLSLGFSCFYPSEFYGNPTLLYWDKFWSVPATSYYSAVQLKFIWWKRWDRSSCSSCNMSCVLGVTHFFKKAEITKKSLFSFSPTHSRTGIRSSDIAIKLSGSVGVSAFLTASHMNTLNYQNDHLLPMNRNWKIIMQSFVLTFGTYTLCYECDDIVE